MTGLSLVAFPMLTPAVKRFQDSGADNAAGEQNTKYYHGRVQQP